MDFATAKENVRNILKNIVPDNEMHSWLIKEKFNALESLFEENDIASIEQIKEATKNISLTPHIMVSVMILKQLNQYSII